MRLNSSAGAPSKTTKTSTKTSKDRREEFEKLLEEGESAYDREDYRTALKVLNRASQICQDEPDVWCLLGLTYQALELDREAWRSFKLALHQDPNDLSSLWYAAQFLYEREDYPLAMSMIERYLELEEDPDERKEAETLKEEIAYHLRESAGVEPALGLDKTEEDEIAEDGVLPEDEFTVIDLEEEEEEELPVTSAEESWDDEEEEDDVLEASFLADLTLQLTDRNSKCIYCGAVLPTDAPYCYNCKEPHLYQALP